MKENHLHANKKLDSKENIFYDSMLILDKILKLYI